MTLLARMTDTATPVDEVRNDPLRSYNATERTTHVNATVFLRRGLPGYLPDAWIIAPSTPAAAPPVVCVHGINREAEAMARVLTKSAEVRGRTVIVPHFTEQDYRRYQRGLCKDRSDKALLRLIHSLQDEGVIRSGVFDLSGFSGGAQFAHRFTWLYPAKVRRLALCAAGWYTFPDTKPFPYGMTGGMVRGVNVAHCLTSNLSAFLNRRVIVRVGALDSVADRNTRKGLEIDAQQGKDRLSRARNWVDAIKAAALRHDITPSVDFAVLEGCGHDFEECVTRGGLDQVFIGHASEPET